MKGSSVEKQILSNKLRLVYERRPCQNIMDTVCAEPDPPTADFPNGWGGFADLMHVDFKIPAEHRINGEKFDGEMQIYHLHPGQRYVFNGKRNVDNIFLISATQAEPLSQTITIPVLILLLFFLDVCQPFHL